MSAIVPSVARPPENLRDLLNMSDHDRARWLCRSPLQSWDVMEDSCKVWDGIAVSAFHTSVPGPLWLRLGWQKYVDTEFRHLTACIFLSGPGIDSEQVVAVSPFPSVQTEVTIQIGNISQMEVGTQSVPTNTGIRDVSPVEFVANVVFLHGLRVVGCAESTEMMFFPGALVTSVDRRSHSPESYATALEAVVWRMHPELLHAPVVEAHSPCCNQEPRPSQEAQPEFRSEQLTRELGQLIARGAWRQLGLQGVLDEYRLHYDDLAVLGVPLPGEGDIRALPEQQQLCDNKHECLVPFTRYPVTYYWDEALLTFLRGLGMDWVGKDEVNVCEVGVAMGMSALVWLTSSHKTRYYAWDIGTWAAAQARLERLRLRFPDRVSWTLGNSSSTIPEFTRVHPDVERDIIVVDGGHTEGEARMDLCNLRRMAAAASVVIVDDARCSLCAPVTRAVAALEQCGMLTTIFAWPSLDAERGFIVARFQ